MQRFRRWFLQWFLWLFGNHVPSRSHSSRAVADGEVYRAMVSLFLTWCGLSLGAFDVLWSMLTHQWGGVMQGAAILLFGWAFLLWHT